MIGSFPGGAPTHTEQPLRRVLEVLIALLNRKDHSGVVELTSAAATAADAYLALFRALPPDQILPVLTEKVTEMLTIVTAVIGSPYVAVAVPGLEIVSLLAERTLLAGGAVCGIPVQINAPLTAAVLRRLENPVTISPGKGLDLRSELD